MLKLRRDGVVLAPTQNIFENKSVLNPAVYQNGETVHMIYRAISNNFISCLGYARLDGPTKVVERWTKPFLAPELKYESKGVEDARLTKIGDTFYLVYIVHDGKNALLAYSFGKDLFNLKRGGIISPKIQYAKAAKLFAHSKLKDDYYFFEAYYKEYAGKNVMIWDKDGFLFPEKIDGQFVMAHRILPDVQLVYFNDFSELKDVFFWGEYLMNLSKHVVLEGEQGWENRHVGGGAPPIKTDHGWLMIYHGTQEENEGRTYRGGAALFDLKNPRKLIARLPYPILAPEKTYELRGHVSEVVFPTGTAIFNKRLYIYYGAADSVIAAGSIELNKLINELLKYKIKTKHGKT